MLLAAIEIALQQSAQRDEWKQRDDRAQHRDQLGVMQDPAGEIREHEHIDAHDGRRGEHRDHRRGEQRLAAFLLGGELAEGGRDALLHDGDQKHHRRRCKRIQIHRFAAQFSGQQDAHGKG